MKFFVTAIAICVSCVEGDYIRRHRLVGPKPSPIEFHGFTGLDIESFKPPARDPAFDKLRKEVALVEAEQHERIQRQLNAAKKAQEDFLNSDLHKTAIHSKLYHIFE
jgi:hypothetical protein